MSIISAVMDHALYNPLIIYSRVKVASEYFSIQCWKVSKKDDFMRVFDLSLNILNDCDVDFNELKHLHCAFQIGNKINRFFICTVNVNFSIPVCKLHIFEFSFNYDDVLTTYILTSFEGINFDSRWQTMTFFRYIRMFINTCNLNIN